MLRQIKAKTDTKPIYGFDIETYDNNREIFCISLYGNGYSKIFHSKRDFIDAIKGLPTCYLVATNLSFDFFGIFFGQQEARNFRFIFRGSNLLYAKTYVVGNNFYKERPDKELNPVCLTFIDTMNYAHLSVSALGDLLTLPKLRKPKALGRLPLDRREQDELETYCIRDAEISAKAVDLFRDKFQSLGANFSFTLASTSMNLFRRKYLTRSYDVHHPDILKEQFQAYSGGRCEAFSRGFINNMHLYDINSLYPYVMTKEYPDTSTLRTVRYGSKKALAYMGISLVTMHATDHYYPYLPVRTSDKLLFPTGRVNGWYTHFEINEAMKLGYALESVDKTYYYKKSVRPFDAFIRDLYEYRQKSQPGMQYVAKILLNSLYGKFGQKFTDRDNIITDPDIKELSKYDKYERIHETPYFRVVKGESKPSPFCMPVWASYITAYARHELYRYLTKYDAIYCDTDSVLTAKEMDTSKKLGGMKHEMTAASGYVIRPKLYALFGNKEYIRAKGCPVRLNKQGFYDLMLSKEISYKKFTRFREAINRQLPPNLIQQCVKSFNLEDKKRVWTRPFHFNEYQASRPIMLQGKNLQASVT